MARAPTAFFNGVNRNDYSDDLSPTDIEKGAFQGTTMMLPNFVKKSWPEGDKQHVILQTLAAMAASQSEALAVTLATSGQADIRLFANYTRKPARAAVGRSTANNVTALLNRKADFR